MICSMIKQTDAIVTLYVCTVSSSKPKPIQPEHVCSAQTGKCRGRADFRATKQACAQRHQARPQQCTCDWAHGSGKIRHMDPGVWAAGDQTHGSGEHLHDDPEEALVDRGVGHIGIAGAAIAACWRWLQTARRDSRCRSPEKQESWQVSYSPGQPCSAVQL